MDKYNYSGYTKKEESFIAYLKVAAVEGCQGSLHGDFMKKKRDKTVFPSLDKHPKKYFGGWTLPGTFVPIPTNDSPTGSHHPFTPPLPSLMQRFIARVRYSSTQIHWDIERWLARKLHRRWY